ncbi:MAG: GTP-binding protein [Candidatus Heimdallarchaeota archaeon]|nr:GTP-binding protein [Candidatus Heimdallarchaeota archaeon]MCK4771191.1 GTP-binding protein [Candidatus Heimdallarchaeota archaeon]
MSFYEFRKRIMEEKKRREQQGQQTKVETSQESVVGRNKFSVALLGLERAGKTSLVKKLLKQDDIVVRPTYGVNLENYQYRDLNFTCFDLGGHQPFRLSLWKKFIERADAVIYLVDSADHARFDESKQTFWHYINFAKQSAPVLFLANKGDLPNSKELVEINESFELDKFLRNLRPFNIKKVSALTGQGVYSAWDWIVDVLCGAQQWKVKIGAAVLSDIDGNILSEALFGRPSEQALVANDFKKLKELTKLFAIETRESIQSVKLESLYKKHVSHVKRGAYCLSVMIDPIDPVTRAQQIQLRILENFSRNPTEAQKNLGEVLESKFPLEVEGGRR